MPPSPRLLPNAQTVRNQQQADTLPSIAEAPTQSSTMLQMPDMLHAGAACRRHSQACAATTKANFPNRQTPSNTTERPKASMMTKPKTHCSMNISRCAPIMSANACLPLLKLEDPCPHPSSSKPLMPMGQHNSWRYPPSSKNGPDRLSQIK